MIELETLKIELIDYENKKHLNYLKKIMASKDITYLWNLVDKDLLENKNTEKYIIVNNNNEYIGYINISDPTDAYFGNTVSLYYAVEESHRGNEYGKKIIEEVSKWLFNKKEIDCIVAQVDPKNIYSIATLTKAGMIEVNRNEEFATFINRKNR